jgi:hypothetical protein
MAPSPVAEATRLTDRCRTFPGREHPGHACREQQRRTLKRPAADGRPARYRSRQARPGNLARPPPPRLSTFPQPRLSTRMQGAEQRLCSNPPQTYAQVVILAGREAAGEQRVSMSQRRKPVISRYAPSSGVGRR